PTPIGVVLKHANEPPPPLHDLRAEIPVEVERVVLRALEKKRENRQESAVRLAQELEGAMIASGIELKNLTRTPQSLYTTMQGPPGSETENTPEDRTSAATGPPLLR